ncbi:MAG TPA: cell surface protein SprA [Gemmatimonadales bacterium]|nr:cell surface protein SprA [Gemmatimonadales bacterium]
MARSAVGLAVLLLVPALLRGQADSGGPGPRFRFPGTLPTLTVPAAHRLAVAALRPDPAGVAAAWAAATRAALDRSRRMQVQSELLQRLYGQSALADSGGTFLGMGKEFVDLAIEGSLGIELRTDRLKNERCTPYELQDPASGCRGNFTAPRIDNDLVVQAGGLVGKRLHINVDYDNKRDFHANNDVRVFYQGLPDEVVQRVEFGTVTWTAPRSRFITATIPAYSFGVNSRFQVGPVTLGALAASQKGSQVTQRTYVIGATTSQPQDRLLRDLDLEQGRFFWVVDPATVTGYPALDVLNLPANAVDESARPREVRIYRYRPSTGSGVTPGLGGITAIGYRPDSGQPTGRVPWQLLVAGQDYVLDPSGLWIALANRLDAGDYLAVSYKTTTTTVGTFPAVDDPAKNDSLLLVVRPHQGSGEPTFRYEMRQVYRVAGTDLDVSSLNVDLTLNRSERPASGASTFLAQLGLAIPTDPDRIDTDNRLFPRTRDVLAKTVFHESYIIFPNLQPFADASRLQPQERDDSLYRTPAYLLLTQGPPARYQFHLTYNAAGGGERNFVDLNAFQIRPGSEQISVGGRPLVPNVDYTISYELGRVTFLDPDALFGTGTATVTARFEERGIFAVAPTTIYGFTGTYQVGQVGSLNAIGVYQQENTVFNRPPVGFEPTADLVGGVTGDFHFRPTWATDAMNALVRGGTRAPSTLDLNGEFAFTAPQANRAGQAYLEEFEAEGGTPVSLRENAWGFGSRPDHPDGVESLGFSAGFDSSDAVALTWQNLVPDASGLQPVTVRTGDIDSLVRLTGGADPIETVMYMTLHADTTGGFTRADGTAGWTLPRRDFRPRWRSIVTPLSVSGTDLSQSEYLEFWVFQGASQSADAAGVRLVVDLGTVTEDALAIAPESLTVVGTDSTWRGRRYAGVGRLDTEREPTGAFNAAIDDNGILIDRPDTVFVGGAPLTDVATCDRSLSGTVTLFGWGDPNVRCTRGNGTLDTEDLNGDNVLDAAGRADQVFRYVVTLGDPKYLVRDGGTGWKLYRIPLRQPDATIGSPNIRLVQHLRVTVAAPAAGSAPDLPAKFALARMRFLGSTWVRRSDAPVLGLSGATSQPHGEVVVTTISTDNRELGYTPPPGVLDQAARADAGRGLQVNERSLRILGRDLQPDERAEGYFRFLAGPQNLLKYRTLKLWVRGRGAGWSDGRLEAVFKVASDDENFYAYRTPAATDTWDPEVVIDLDVWRALRAQIETRWLEGLPPSGAGSCGAGDSTAYVACQGHYLVQVKDPGINPPNLAAVQEIDAAVHYAGTGAPLTEAELWVDDIRLVDPVNKVGTATAFSARLAAADVADLSLSLVRQDGNFQQIGADPTFRTTTTAQVGTSVRVDRFLPKGLGIVIPATISYTRSTIDPTLVTGTDLRASDLPGLRTPSASQVSWGFTVRRSERGKSWLVRGLADPLSLTGNFSNGSSRTELSAGTSSSYALGLAYSLAPRRHGPRLPFAGVVAGLPKWLRESPVGEGLRGSILALAPTSVRINSGLARNQYGFTTYQVVIQRPSDSLDRPSLNLTNTWRNSAGLTLQPLGMLTLDGDLSSTRDLRRYDDSTSLGRLAGASRRQLLGMDVGVERDRQFTSSMLLQPRVATWFRPRYLRSSNFALQRNLTSRDPVRIGVDSGAFLLPQTYNNFRSEEVGASTDLNRLAAIVAGDSGIVATFFRRFRPLDLTYRTSHSSTFDLATFAPDLGYVFASGTSEEFLHHGGVTADYAAEGSEARLTSGADLPGGFSLSLSRANIITRSFNGLGGALTEAETRQTEWPQGSARWSQAVRKGPVVLITLGAQFNRREGITLQPSASGSAQARTVSGTFGPDLTVGLRNGLTATLSYQRNTQLQEGNDNRTENTNDQWSGTLAQSFRLPASLSVTRKRVRASMYGQSITSSTCLFLASSADEGCKPVADFSRLVLNGGLSSEVLPLAEAGLNFQYVLNESKNLNQRTSQISIVATLRIQLTSSALR